MSMAKRLLQDIIEICAFSDFLQKSVDKMPKRCIILFAG